jgi:hypothetical protein
MISWEFAAPPATSVAAGLGLVLGVLFVSCSVVCALKAKWWVAVLGWFIPSFYCRGPSVRSCLPSRSHIGLDTGTTTMR